LTSGASGGVSNLLKIVIANPSCGVMIPIPQYPLYTAELALNDAKAVPYYLIEEEGWGINVDQMREALQKARSEGTDVRALVIINPGNPTGQCLPLEQMQDLVKFAYEERLVLMADEVYQTNVFDKSHRPFYSFKKVAKELGEPYANNLELVSFHSMSKGQIGECGRRGGFFEIVNFDESAVDQVYKLASIQLCPGLSGQIGIDLMVDPPKEGDESYKQYSEEISTIHTALRQRSQEICKAFEKMEGVTCNPAEVCRNLPMIDLQ
jgi:alanine transaminase